MKNSILIIGSTGFIGKNITEVLLSYGYKLILLVRKFSTIPDNFKNNPLIKFVEADLENISLIEKIIETNNIKIVMHLASNLIPSSGKDEFNKELEELILPTYLLLEYLSGKNIKVIFFSSGGTIYGRVDGTRTKEDYKLKQINYYGQSKLMIENYITYLHRTKKLPYLIFRPSNVYGKYQRLEAKQGFISVAIGKILSNSPVEIWGDGNTIRDYINVEDVALIIRAFINMNVENKIINIGSGKGTSLNQIIKYLGQILNINIEVAYKDKRNIDVDKIILDTTMMRSLINVTPISLEEGIKKYINYLKIKIEK